MARIKMVPTSSTTRGNLEDDEFEVQTKLGLNMCGVPQGSITITKKDDYAVVDGITEEMTERVQAFLKEAQWDSEVLEDEVS